MRVPARRALSRLVLPALLLACLLPSLLPGRDARAAAAINLTILDPHTALIHLSGSGFPIDRMLFVTIYSFPLARPDLVDAWHPAIAFVQGSVNQDFFLGFNACGNFLRAVVSDDQDTLAESATVFGLCTAPTPAVAIGGVSGTTAQVVGQGFQIQETVSITVTEPASGNFVEVGGITDNLGGLSVAVPIGGLPCFNSLVATVTGAAGSSATSAPFFYPCPVPPSPTPVPTAAPLAQASGHLSSRPARPAGLDLANTPPIVSYNQVETLRMSTGVPGAWLTVRLWGQGLALGSYTAHADGAGNASLAYRVPLRLAPRQRRTVYYTAVYTAGTQTWRGTGSFTVVG